MPFSSRVRVIDKFIWDLVQFLLPLFLSLVLFFFNFELELMSNNDDPFQWRLFTACCSTPTTTTTVLLQEQDHFSSLDLVNHCRPFSNSLSPLSWWQENHCTLSLYLYISLPIYNSHFCCEECCRYLHVNTEIMQHACSYVKHMYVRTYICIHCLSSYNVPSYRLKT